MNCLIIPILVRSYRENSTVELAKCLWKEKISMIVRHPFRHILFTAESVFQTKYQYKILLVGAECAWQNM
jgi:hypothetical protein